MLEIHKKVVLDEDIKPFAVQIPIAEFERLEEVLENYGLSKMIDVAKEGEGLKLSGATTRKELVNLALRELVDNRKRRNLLDLAGKIEFAEGYARARIVPLKIY